jgi:hypothetical protein
VLLAVSHDDHGLFSLLSTPSIFISILRLAFYFQLWSHSPFDLFKTYISAPWTPIVALALRHTTMTSNAANRRLRTVTALLSLRLHKRR